MLYCAVLVTYFYTSLFSLSIISIDIKLESEKFQDKIFECAPLHMVD